MWLYVSICTFIYFVFFALLTYLILLYRIEDTEEKKLRFKITHPIYKKLGNKRYANFVIVVIGKHTVFFSDFPLIFRFYSDNRFKSRIKISYSTDDYLQKEEILNKVVTFEKHAIEFMCPVTDIIPSEIHIEIEVNPEYGYPNAIFEIRKNHLSLVTHDLIREIIFPK